MINECLLPWNNNLCMIFVLDLGRIPRSNETRGIETKESAMHMGEVYELAKGTATTRMDFGA